MMTRKTFLHRLMAVPLVAVLAPAVASIGSQDEPAVATFVGQEGTTLTAAVSRLPAPGEPIYTPYMPEEAGDWVGYLEPVDKGWLTFIDKAGRAVTLVRDASGEFQHGEVAR